MTANDLVGRQLTRDRDSRTFEEIAHFIARGEQPHHFSPHCAIVWAQRLKMFGAVLSRLVQKIEEQLFYSLSLRRRHEQSSAYSQAWANTQSRCTVATDTPSTAAVSSAESVPKKRSITT